MSPGSVASEPVVTVSEVSASMNPAVHPVSSVVPLFATVSWSWEPPDQELETDEVSVHVPVAGGGAVGPVDVV